MYGEWKRLVVQYGVLGVKVHDARLIAAMNVHGVRRLLTFDVGDFTRYGIELLQPSSVLS
jgi:predicted nucleic acid-binding protein